jgi:hypothetical protein
VWAHTLVIDRHRIAVCYGDKVTPNSLPACNSLSLSPCCLALAPYGRKQWHGVERESAQKFHLPKH